MDNGKILDQIAVMNHCYQRFQIDTFLQDVSDIGYKKIDLWSCPYHYFVDSNYHQDTKTFKEKLTEYNLEISCFSPSQSRPRAFNIAAKGLDMIQQVKKFFQQVVYSAYELEAPRIMITAGDSFIDEPVEEAWQRAVRMCYWLCDFAQQYNILICIEPLTKKSSHIVYSLETMQKFMQAVNHENLYVIVDTGTVKRNGESISDYFKIFGKKINYCHLTSYKKNEFSHVAWQDGEYSLKKVLKEFNDYNYQGDYCLEYTAKAYQKNPKKVYLDSFNYIKNGGRM